MKHWILAGAAFLIAGSIYGASHAQSDGEQPAPGGGPREACTADIEKLCAGVDPGGHQIMQCLRQHQDDLSDGCKSTLMSARANHHWRHDAAPGDSDTPPQTPSPPMPPAQDPATAAP
jgi:hypothetical protein